MLDEDTGSRFEFPYFGADRKPLVLCDEVSYADPDADQPSHTLYQWIHSLGDVVSALAGAGLTIEWLHEFDYSPTPAIRGCTNAGMTTIWPTAGGTSRSSRSA